MDAKAPIAEKISTIYDLHDIQREDFYAWMRDDEREDPKILAHLAAENAYKEAVLADEKELRNKLFEEIKAKIKKDDASVPHFYNGYWYYNRYEVGKDYAIHCRKKENLEATEEIILDENIEAEGENYYVVGALAVSPDNKKVAYAIDFMGRLLFTMKVRSLETGEMLDTWEGEFDNDLVWANDNEHLFYVHKDAQTLRAYQVLRHKIGEKTADDKLIYEEEDESFLLNISKTKSRNYIEIFAQSTTSTESILIDANHLDSACFVFFPRIKDHLYDLHEIGNVFYLRSNLFSKNFCLAKTNLENRLDELKWEIFKDSAEHSPIVEFDVFENKIIVVQRVAAVTELFCIENGIERKIAFDEEIHAVSLGFNPDFSPPAFRFYYNSLTTPARVMEYDFAEKAAKILKQSPVLGDFDANNYESKRVWITARDGVKVPVSLVYHKNTPPNGENPLYLYAYGSYSISIDPYFSIVRLSLLDRGFTYAIAHIRGGEEMGREWYENGKLNQKKNTFQDFIDCAEGLIAAKMTAPDKVFACGGSAGGLLMGAVINMRPDLFRGVAAHVPFVDVVTTMLDPTLPLTTFEYEEWGNPNEKEAFDYMLSYSPYDNVTKKAYPNLLVTCGLHDSQVQYFEPAKWVAKLRELKTDNNMLLFQINMEAGHYGGSGRFEKIKDSALEYAFFFKILGIKD